MGSHFAQNTTVLPPPSLVPYSSATQPFRGYVHTQNSPKPTPKHPFSWPELESGQNELLSGQFWPHPGKIFEKWEKISRIRRKKIIHVQTTCTCPAVGAASASSQPRRASSPLATRTIGSWSTQQAPRPATMKTVCIHPALLLFVVESTQGWLQSVQICQ